MSTIADQVAALEVQQLKSDFDRHLVLLGEAAALKPHEKLDAESVAELVELRGRLGFQCETVAADIAAVRTNDERKASQLEAEAHFAGQPDPIPMRHAIDQCHADLKAFETQVEEKVRAINRDISKIDGSKEQASRARQFWEVHHEQNRRLLEFGNFLFHRRNPQVKAR